MHSRLPTSHNGISSEGGGLSPVEASPQMAPDIFSAAALDPFFLSNLLPLPPSMAYTEKKREVINLIDDSIEDEPRKRARITPPSSRAEPPAHPQPVVFGSSPLLAAPSAPRSLTFTDETASSPSDPRPGKRPRPLPPRVLAPTSIAPGLLEAKSAPAPVATMAAAPASLAPLSDASVVAMRGSTRLPTSGPKPTSQISSRAIVGSGLFSTPPSQVAVATTPPIPPGHSDTRFFGGSISSPPVSAVRTAPALEDGKKDGKFLIENTNKYPFRTWEKEDPDLASTPLWTFLEKGHKKETFVISHILSTAITPFTRGNKSEFLELICAQISKERAEKFPQQFFKVYRDKFKAYMWCMEPTIDALEKLKLMAQPKCKTKCIKAIDKVIDKLKIIEDSISPAALKASSLSPSPASSSIPTALHSVSTGGGAGAPTHRPSSTM